MVINNVATHAIGRADIVLRRKIGECFFEISKEALVPHGDLNAGRATLPDSHQPNGVNTVGSDCLPLLFRNRIQVCGPPVKLTDLMQPDPGVDLKDDGVFRPWPQFFFPPATKGLSWNAISLPRSRSCLGSRQPYNWMILAIRPDQPVWWLAPIPAPLSPWKYS